MRGEITDENKVGKELIEGIFVDLIDLSVVDVTKLVICFDIVNGFVVEILRRNEFETIFNCVEICLF